MKNQNIQSEARNLVDKIIANNDASPVGQLTLNLNSSDKSNLLGSIKKLDYDPISTPYGVPI